MSVEYSIPNDIMVDFVEKKVINNDLVQDCVELKFQLSVLKNKINAIESRRAVNFDELIILVKNVIPELGYGNLSFDFDKLTVIEGE